MRPRGHNARKLRDQLYSMDFFFVLIEMQGTEINVLPLVYLLLVCEGLNGYIIHLFKQKLYLILLYFSLIFVSAGYCCEQIDFMFECIIKYLNWELVREVWNYRLQTRTRINADRRKLCVQCILYLRTWIL